MTNKLTNLIKNNLASSFVICGAFVATSILSCTLQENSSTTNVAIGGMGALLATGAAIVVSFLDSKYGNDIYSKIYSGDNQYIKTLIQYSIPSTISAIVVSPLIALQNTGAIAPIISAFVQTSVLKYCETVSEIEQCFFGEDIDSLTQNEALNAISNPLILTA